jgi:quinol monooxygenase YgiN
MYGTVAKTQVRSENREKMRALVHDQMTRRDVPGFVTSYVLEENDSDTVWMFAVFEDRETYDRNADDPAMDADYREYRALMESDPEWHDGRIEVIGS